MRNDLGMENRWDCIVVGAGAAGLSAALVLGRARQRTLVVDAGGQSNLAAHGIGGLLGHDARPPAQFYAAGRDELAAYPTVELRAGEVLRGERHDAGFVLELADGSREPARRVLLATGMDYRYPALAGIAERWGRSVFHCPFCHGWEVRDQPLGVLDRGATAVHRALLLRVWSDDVTLLADGPAELDAEDAERLRAAGVAVDERHIAGLRGPDSTLTVVTFADRERAPSRRAARACHPAPALRAGRAARRRCRRPGTRRGRRRRGRLEVPHQRARPLRRGRRERADAVRGERGRRGLKRRGDGRRRPDD